MRTSLSLFVVACLLGFGCAGSKTSPPSSPQTLVEAQPETTPAPLPPASEVEPAEREQPPEPAEDPTVTVIDPGGARANDRTTLAEASRTERDRRVSVGRSVAVIDDDNLADFAEGGELTFVESPKVPKEVKLVEDLEKKGEHWREAVLRQRIKWGQLVDEIIDLDSRVAELRRRFYAEDDPAFRDTQIKPEWDRTLDRLSDARVNAALAEVALQELLEEGRRAGAQPGWLRAGLQFEPTTFPYDRPEDREENSSFFVDPNDRESLIAEPIEIEEVQ